MVPPFDIFKLQKDGSLRWCETADTVEAAKARVTALAETSPARYIIFDQQTGDRIVIDTPSAGGATNSLRERDGPGGGSRTHTEQSSGRF